MAANLASHSSTLSIFSFLLLLSLSHARFPPQSPNDDASPEAAVTSTAGISSIEKASSHADPKILLPTDKLREPSDPAPSTAAVNFEEARSEGKGSLPAANILPDKDPRVVHNLAGAGAEKPLPLEEQQWKPYDMMLVAFHPMTMMMNHHRLDRPWMMRRQSFFRPRNHPDSDHPNGDGPHGPHHHPFPGGRHHSRWDEDRPMRETTLPFFDRDHGMRGEGKEGMLMAREFERPDFHRKDDQPDFRRYHDCDGEDFQGDDDDDQEGLEFIEPKRGFFYNRMRKFLP